KRAVLIDTDSGLVLQKFDYSILSWPAAGPSVVSGPVKFAPHVPLPKHAHLPDKGQVSPEDLAKAEKAARERGPDSRGTQVGRGVYRDSVLRGVWAVDLNRDGLRKQLATTLDTIASRPPVVEPDRTALKVVSPHPPANSAPLPAVRPVEPLGGKMD